MIIAPIPRIEGVFGIRHVSVTNIDTIGYIESLIIS